MERKCREFFFPRNFLPKTPTKRWNLEWTGEFRILGRIQRTNQTDPYCDLLSTYFIKKETCIRLQQHLFYTLYSGSFGKYSMLLFALLLDCVVWWPSYVPAYTILLEIYGYLWVAYYRLHQVLRPQWKHMKFQYGVLFGMTFSLR